MEKDNYILAFLFTSFQNNLQFYYQIGNCLSRTLLEKIPIYDSHLFLILFEKIC